MKLLTLLLTAITLVFMSVSGFGQTINKESVMSKPTKNPLGVSPFYNHRKKVKEKEAAEAQKKALENQQEETIKTAAKEGNKFKLLLQNLEADLKRISSLPLGPEREKLKKEQILPVYLPIIEKYLEGKEIYANPVLTQVMIWLFDVGEIDQAWKLAQIAIEQKQAMPERYKRDVKTFAADALKEWSKAEINADRTPEPYLTELSEKILSDSDSEPEWLVHEDIRIEVLKQKGRLEEKAGNFKEALELYKQAEAMNPKKAKVKTVVAKLEKELSKES